MYKRQPPAPPPPDPPLLPALNWYWYGEFEIETPPLPPAPAVILANPQLVPVIVDGDANEGVAGFGLQETPPAPTVNTYE